MRILSILLLSFSLFACQSAYYSAMETIGVHKRDLMVDRVEAASEAQQQASEEFKTTLESFSELTNFQGGDLEAAYKTIEGQYKDSEKAVQNVRNRIEGVEGVSEALFKEWQEELELYSSPSLKKDSENKLKATQVSYQKMLASMKKAEQKMEPVLATLRDNTLFLKHNLNAAAIGSLQNEFANLKLDIDLAIKEMNAAISESNKFLATIK